MSIPSAYATDHRKKNRIPKPKNKFQLLGCRLLVFQDEPDEKIGRIYVPKDAQKRHNATVGTVVRLGDGIDDGMPETDPFHGLEEMDRVYWGRWEDVVLRLEVEDDWWDSAEEKDIERGKVEFTLLHIKDVLGVIRRDS